MKVVLGHSNTILLGDVYWGTAGEIFIRELLKILLRKCLSISFPNTNN
jgi:hypothetical protein